MWKHKQLWTKIGALLLTLSLALGLAGCGQYRITTGYQKTEFIRYNGKTVGMDRALLLTAEYRRSYEEQFDSHIWKETVDGVSMETYVKDLVRDTVEHLIFLEKMATDMGIHLTDEEQHLLEQATTQYMASYASDLELPFTEQTVREYYRSLLLAEKAFYAITEDVDTEVSTDEARIIDVQYLFFSKYMTNENGDLVLLSSSARNKKKQLAQNVRKMILEGEDINSLIQEYSEDSRYFLEFGRGDYELDFEQAAFALEIGDVSEVVETSYGYYIIKCTNDNVSDDYERRKESIVLERRKELFAESYASYAEGVKLHYNSYFWDEISIADMVRGSGKLQEVFDSVYN